MTAANTARTLFDKVWDAHVIESLGDGWALLHVDRHLLHDLSGSRGLAALDRRELPVRNPELALALPDHAVSSAPGRTGQTFPGGEQMWRSLRDGSGKHGIRLFDIGNPFHGIVHVTGPEQGFVLPGSLVVCGDSHTCTNGALGALAFGIGSSELMHVLATQTLAQRKPKTMRIRFEGRLEHASAKDLILATIGRLGASAGTGYAVEYCGPAIERMSIEERLTICNLSIEMGAKFGMIAPDATTFAYLAGRPFSPHGELFERGVAHWKTLVSDEGAHFDREETIDASAVVPMMTWGTSPEHVIRIGARVPSDEDSPDAMRREEWRAARDYMGLEQGTARGPDLHRFVHQFAPVGPHCSRRPAARPPRRRACGSLGRRGIGASQARGRGTGPARAVRSRGHPVARAGLQHVRCGQWRSGAAGPARDLHVESQFRRAARPRGADAPGQP
jgi:3-isopropylmalate/(R)-2-methylmalate dehydratase large subunit